MMNSSDGWASVHDPRRGNPSKMPISSYTSAWSGRIGLGQCLLGSIEEVHGYATKRLWTHTDKRHNMDIGGVTPMQK